METSALTSARARAPEFAADSPASLSHVDLDAVTQRLHESSYSTAFRELIDRLTGQSRAGEQAPPPGGFRQAVDLDPFSPANRTRDRGHSGGDEGKERTRARELPALSMVAAGSSEEMPAALARYLRRYERANPGGRSGGDVTPNPAPNPRPDVNPNPPGPGPFPGPNPRPRPRPGPDPGPRPDDNPHPQPAPPPGPVPIDDITPQPPPRPAPDVQPQPRPRPRPEPAPCPPGGV